MCGRFSISVKYKSLSERFNLDFIEGYNFKPVYNAAPSLFLPVITDEKPLCIRPLKWGLIPSWVTKNKNWKPLINARLETLDKKTSFKKLIKTGRCIIPSDGFFEWERNGSRKLPYRITLKEERIFCYAGLWDQFVDEETERTVKTFTIITTESKFPVTRIHNRMPLILSREEEIEWLKEGMSIMKSKDDISSELQMHRVSELVNNPANNVPEILDELSEHGC